MDSSGNAYVTGQTCSSNFPTAHPLQASLGSGYGNAFVAELNSTGSALVYSTYLGGSGQDQGNGIAVDSSGNAYVAGSTSSTDFPLAYPLQASLAGSPSAFVSKLNWDASTSTLSLVYSTYLGGSWDEAYGIAVDSSGNAYVTGETGSNFPTAHPLQANLGGANSGNAFVAELNWAVSTSTLSLVYSTYLGGSGFDQGSGIAVDSSGNAYVAGSTSSTDFPLAYPLQASLAAGYWKAFISKLNWDASTSTLSLVYSTYLGGSSWDYGYGIAVDSSGNDYVTGWTWSSDFPTAHPLQARKAGEYNVFVSKLNWAASTSTLSLVYSTYLGGSGFDQGSGIAVDSSGNAYVTGYTCSSDFPTSSPFQVRLKSDSLNAFVAEIGAANSAGIAFGPGALTFGGHELGATSGVQSVILTAAGSQPLNVSSITPSGDFALATTATSCPYAGGTVPSASACTLDVTFTPTADGKRTGSLSVQDNASGSPQAVPLSGTGIGVPAATLSPTSLSFGNQAFKTTSTAEQVILTSSGTAYLGFSSITFVGTNPGDFAQTNNCPHSMAPGTKCTISVTLTPSLLGGESATLDVNDSAAGSPQTVGLSGNGLADATLTPASYNFGNVAIKTPSNPETFTLLNNESTALNISSIGFTGANYADFSQTGGTCGTAPTSLGAGASCTISVTFTPSVLGAESASLTVNDNAAAAQYQTLTSALSGAGLADATLGPTSYNFGNVAIKTPSNPETFTLLNNESTPLNISSIGFTGTNSADFSQTGGTCGTAPTGLAAGSACSIRVTFAPSALGLESATLTVNDSAAATQYRTLTSPLSGAGVADATLTPAPANFGNIALNTASNPKNLTLKNNELLPLSISNIRLTGANYSDFSQTNTCGPLPASLAAGGSCTISVTFTPSTLITEKATLTVNDNAAVAQYQTLTSALSGAGVADATLGQASYDFGNVAIDEPSNAQTFTLKNNELTALNISSIGFTGANGGDFSQTGGTCGPAPTSLGAGKSCTIGVTFTPSTLAVETATLTVDENAPAPYNELTSALGGVGVADATLWPASYYFGRVAVHTASTPESFTLTNNQSVALKISSIGFTGTNGGDFSQTGGTCGTAPTSLAAGTSCTITVTFTPSGTGAESATMTVNGDAPAPYNTLTSSLTGGPPWRRR